LMVLWMVVVSVDAMVEMLAVVWVDVSVVR